MLSSENVLALRIDPAAVSSGRRQAVSDKRKASVASILSIDGPPSFSWSLREKALPKQGPKSVRRFRGGHLQQACIGGRFVVVGRSPRYRSPHWTARTESGVVSAM